MSTSTSKKIELQKTPWENRSKWHFLPLQNTQHYKDENVEYLDQVFGSKYQVQINVCRCIENRKDLEEPHFGVITNYLQDQAKIELTCTWCKRIILELFFKQTCDCGIPDYKQSYTYNEYFDTHTWKCTECKKEFKL